MATSARAADLRAALATSSRLAADVDAVLWRYQTSLGRALKAVGPTVERTQALRAARDEVRAALADAELTLHHLDAPRRVEAAVLAGPEADLPGFLRALAELGAAVSFLEPRRDDLPAADAAVDSAADLRRDGLALALRNFVTLLQLHGDGGSGGGGEVEEEDDAVRWRPSGEGVPPAAGDPDLDDDSEGSETAADGGGSEAGRARSSTPFLRVADESPAPALAPSKASTTTLLPAPVTARLRALAEAMVGAPAQAACVKAYCDVRWERVNAALAALASPMPVEGADGEGSEAVREWTERWTAGVASLPSISDAEVGLAAAIFDEAHAQEAVATVLTRAADLVTASVQEMVGRRRHEGQALPLIITLGALSPSLAALHAALCDPAFVRIWDRLHGAEKALEGAVRAQLDDFLNVRTFSGGSYGASAVDVMVVARTLAHLEALLVHAPVLAAVCGGVGDAGDPRADEFAAQDAPADQQTIPPAASAFVLRALNTLVDGLDTKARGAKTKVGSCVLAMNGVSYLLATLKNSGALRACVPADASSRWAALVEAALADLRITLWGPLVDLLASDRPGGLSKDAAKSVTALLQVVDESRAALAIVDDDLRSRVRDAVTAEVVEPYELLLSTAVDPSILKHLRYSAADVRGLVEGGDFFVLRDDDRGGSGGGGGGSGVVAG